MCEIPEDLNICACVGPQNGEPYCPCTMRREGLETGFKWIQEDIDQLQKALEYIFDPINKNPQVTNRDRI
jgi:hypothetical protein